MLACLQADAVQRTPGHARSTLIPTPQPIVMADLPSTPRATTVALQQQLTRMRAAQIARCKARTGVCSFPVPAPPGARGRWVRGAIVAETAKPWLEEYLAAFDLRCDEQKMGRADAARAAFEVRKFIITMPIYS